MKIVHYKKYINIDTHVECGVKIDPFKSDRNRRQTNGNGDYQGLFACVGADRISDVTLWHREILTHKHYYGIQIM